MSWLTRYRLRHYLDNSIWIFPVLGILAALLTVRLLHRVDQTMGWESSFDPETARSVLGTMASSMFTFIVFVCSALLVAVQLASSQLTPRIIANVFRDPVMRFSMTVFVFAFTFTLAALVRINASVPMVTAEVAAYSCLASLAVFLYLIDHVRYLPESRAARLRAELELLHRSADRLFADPEDRALAHISDYQGVGGQQGRSRGDRQVKESTP
jgi:uncharacterized membrane protein